MFCGVFRRGVVYMGKDKVRGFEFIYLRRKYGSKSGRLRGERGMGRG
jgi:hypothetical protein